MSTQVKESRKTTKANNSTANKAKQYAVKDESKGIVASVAKKASESTILKRGANNNWKDNTRSLSALVRYCKGEGRQDLEKIIEATNVANKKGIAKGKLKKVSFGQVANVKNIVANATERELNDKQGNKKELFSFWLVVLTVGRLARKVS